MSLHLGGLRARHERRGHPRRRRRRHGGSPRRQAGHRPRHPRCSLEHKEQPVTCQWTFTSESVTEGHPDKMADQISDSILDAILAEDTMARVACETMVTTGLAIVRSEERRVGQECDSRCYTWWAQQSETNK